MKKDNILWGFGLIAIAVLIILGNLGMIGGIEKIGTFTIIFTILLCIMLVKAITDIEIIEGLLAVALLCIVWAEPLSDIAPWMDRITPWPVLVAAVIAGIGIDKVFDLSSIKKKKKNQDNFAGSVEYREDDDEDIEIFSKYGNVERKVMSSNLKSISINNDFGAIKVDLVHAQSLTGYVDMKVHCGAGAIEIKIPANWVIENNIVCKGGAVKIDGNNSSGGTVKLHIEGEVNLGAVHIEYV